MQVVAENWDLPNTEVFQSKDVASVKSIKNTQYVNMIKLCDGIIFLLWHLIPPLPPIKKQQQSFNPKIKSKTNKQQPVKWGNIIEGGKKLG
jgi:hypothetical protein